MKYSKISYDSNAKHWLSFKRVAMYMVFITLLFTSMGCKKFIAVAPPITSTNSDNIYSNDGTAISVLTSLYAKMSAENSNNFVSSGFNSLGLYTGLSADEITLFSGSTNPVLTAYYQNKLNNTVTNSVDVFETSYPYIFTINAAIEGLTKSTTLTPSVKNELLGEAYFMRAFFYFYLTNLYSEVPLILVTDYNITSKQGSIGQNEIYNQIKVDLLKAQNLMADKFYDGTLLSGTGERVRPNKTAATALLARVYLYNKEWSNAETEATEVIQNSTTYKIEPDLNTVFLIGSKETIWSLQSVNNNSASNTGDGAVFILTGPPDENFHPFYLSSSLINSFDHDDLRLTNWTQHIVAGGQPYDYAYKYKLDNTNNSTGEYLVIFRLAEQYLIRAEARARLGNIVGSNSAKSDIDVIRLRAGLRGTAATSMPDMINNILLERRHELFTEWGHRWLDLKRTNTVDSVMTTATALKGAGSWDSHMALFPIPYGTIQANPNIKQNPGY
ncbi:Starch-binding associating with outer membrane [Mucilaginibacter pineti]|uniref:Starch-binding associating with outer membrane n=1 Tax=Mucilaginibacter pineti TaxID=1391627 RepID=A0A1G7GAB8_9SPHI|nr:RagB/SusD family nutrient uptake outer membrane protein [Mucilaginibacter pineti]SDE85043.1 Starch-binding associating with outer membrane [Mucilaginibacter pineti]